MWTHACGKNGGIALWTRISAPRKACAVPLAVGNRFAKGFGMRYHTAPPDSMTIIAMMTMVWLSLMRDCSERLPTFASRRRQTPQPRREALSKYGRVLGENAQNSPTQNMFVYVCKFTTYA